VPDGEPVADQERESEKAKTPLMVVQLREYYPGMLEAAAHRSGSLITPAARELLRIAPTPAEAARLPVTRIATALRRAGRQRGIEQSAAGLHEILHRPQLRQDPLVERAMGAQALRLPLRKASVTTGRSREAGRLNGRGRG
jgi:hypothetical protein